MFLMFLYFIFSDKSGIITGGLAGKTAMYFYKEVEYMVYSLTLVIVCITFILGWSQNLSETRIPNHCADRFNRRIDVFTVSRSRFRNYFYFRCLT